MQQLTRAEIGADAIAFRPPNMSDAPQDVWRDRIHDLGNLIQVATSALTIMARDAEPLDKDKVRMVVSAARSSLERASLIVRTGLRDARACPTRGKAIVAECFEHLRVLAAPLIGAGISLDLGIEAGLPMIACDADCLERALINLLINARDAMPYGGHVSITARVDATKVILAVEDSGCGMSQDQLRLAAQPFYTTKAKGTGVGLATVRDFMELTGGDLFIASELGVGTCIELRFPVAPN